MVFHFTLSDRAIPDAMLSDKSFPIHFSISEESTVYGSLSSCYQTSVNRAKLYLTNWNMLAMLAVFIKLGWMAGFSDQGSLGNMVYPIPKVRLYYKQYML